MCSVPVMLFICVLTAYLPRRIYTSKKLKTSLIFKLKPYVFLIILII